MLSTAISTQFRASKQPAEVPASQIESVYKISAMPLSR